MDAIPKNNPHCDKLVRVSKECEIMLVKFGRAKLLIFYQTKNNKSNLDHLMVIFGANSKLGDDKTRFES
jgi:hypothetical protein